METGFSKGSQQQFCRQRSFHPSSPCFLSPSLSLSISSSVSLCLSHVFSHSLPVFANGSREREREKKKENQEAMFPKTATQRQHLLRLANS